MAMVPGRPPTLTCAACGAVDEVGARFCGQCGSALIREGPGRVDRADAPPSEGSPNHRPPLRTGERRHLTVMFSDMAGSSALAERLDPEDLRDVIRAFQDACVRAIAQFDGTAAKFMGDGVLAYFGYPHAHEDDAERAVRAGLTVIDEVGGLTLQTAVRLEVRVGIATGVVVVGETVGEGEQVVIGETPNLAARLQGLARPNTVVIADNTKQLLGGRFDLEDLGEQSPEGMAHPISSWLVLGERAAESRFEARHAPRATGQRVTAMFGREREVGLMMDCWARTLSEGGRVVLLSGEAGIGKSRVVEALRQTIRDEPHTRIQCQCSPHHAHSPLYPVIAQLERAAGFAQDDTASIRLAKLEHMLAQSSSIVHRVAPLFATLLSLPFEDRYPAPALTPREQKERTLSALIDYLAGLARQRPVLFVLEDAHWIDPTSLELLTRTMNQVHRWPILLVVTSRPEFELYRGPTAPHVTALTLDRLEQDDVVALIDSLTEGKPLPADVRNEIVAKTDGVPLFVEELTKAVIASGLVEEAADRYVLRGPQAPMTIPATLHDSLLARLDHLGPATEVAQLAAAIGREFSWELLDAVAPMHGEALGDALGQLVKAGLILGRGAPPGATPGSTPGSTYVFKHALVQDAAYGSLLRSTRRQLHGRIARAITELTPQIVETQPELLAHHYGQAGLVDDAVACGLKAGRSAARRSANEEAITHCTRALELLGAKPAGIERDRQELELLVALGVPTFAARGYMAPDVERIYERARDLCDDVPDTPHRFTVLRGLWNSAFMRKPLALSQNLGAELLVLANAQDNDTRRALACRAHGCSLFFRGEFESAGQRFRQAVDLWHIGKARAEIVVYGEDPSVLCRAYGSWLLWFLGYPEESDAWIGQALADARAVANPFIHAMTLGLASALHVHRGETLPALERADASSGLSARHGFPQWTAYAQMCRGWVRAALGEAESGIAEMEKGWADWQALGAQLATTHATVRLAEACARTGRVSAGLDWIGVAAEHVRSFHECFLEAEMHRLHGELLLGRGATVQAEASLRRAMEVARLQKAKSLELRAAMTLAQCWQRDGQRRAAHDLVAPIFGWFSQGFDTPDLQKARALLDELR